jgi:aspartate/tyrosine/aromatic aminotransferase
MISGSGGLKFAFDFSKIINQKIKIYFLNITWKNHSCIA